MDTKLNLQLPFSVNQQVIDEALSAYLPTALSQLEMKYISGRGERGLKADFSIPEAVIKAAVIARARQLVAADFTHFSVDFIATRSDDGITANIVASTTPLTDEVPVQEQSRSTAKPVEQEPATAVEQEETPPFEEDEKIETQEEQPAAQEEVKPQPRAKLFGSLTRPTNETPAED